MKFGTALGLSIGGIFIGAILMCVSFLSGLDLLANLFGLCIVGFFIALLVVGLRELKLGKTTVTSANKAKFALSGVEE